ncbi:MAG: SDR family oxidoreductase [Burkholderiaceae bacterium]|nr:SDR family oxidoreductase [Burkholderiaceae bacterium]MEB2350900.1 SDR family oxidoreductase [Burkholderiaceae bacterium]
MPLLEGCSRRWLVTGAAGFIGSNLVETLLRAGQQVVGLDNFATGFCRNLDEVRVLVGETAWARFRFVEGDVCDVAACRDAVRGAGETVDVVLHQAALGSVPRSIEQPLRSYAANVDGFVKLIDTAREAGVKRFVYASSSSVYGDHEALPKVEDRVGRVLSPYAATKVADELFADTWARVYAMTCVGLRYFNVFGPRQDPDGAYAAVVPRWAAAMLSGEPVWINGDGLTSRDFCYVANAVQANLRAGLVATLPRPHEVFNVAVGERTTLLELFETIRRALGACEPARVAVLAGVAPQLRDFRVGDVRHSLADIGRTRALLGYAPTHRLDAGLAASIGWYVDHLAKR